MENVIMISDHKDFSTDSLSWEKVDVLNDTIEIVKGRLSVEAQEREILERAYYSDDIPF